MTHPPPPQQRILLIGGISPPFAVRDGAMR
jgi:hypothetical protein